MTYHGIALILGAESVGSAVEVLGPGGVAGFGAFDGAVDDNRVNGCGKLFASRSGQRRVHERERVEVREAETRSRHSGT